MLMGLTQGVYQDLRVEMVLVCNACGRSGGPGNDVFSSSGRVIASYELKMWICQRIGICPLCGLRVGAPTPDWIMRRAMAIHEGKVTDNGKVIERCAPGAASGAMMNWDFK